MARDWKQITDDEILNFDGPQTAEIARYERIMRRRSIEATRNLRDGLTELMQTLHRSSQLTKEGADALLQEQKKASISQRRQQIVIIALTVVIALSAVLYT